MPSLRARVHCEEPTDIYLLSVTLMIWYPAHRLAFKRTTQTLNMNNDFDGMKQ